MAEPQAPPQQKTADSIPGTRGGGPVNVIPRSAAWDAAARNHQGPQHPGDMPAGPGS